MDDEKIGKEKTTNNNTSTNNNNNNNNINTINININTNIPNSNKADLDLGLGEELIDNSVKTKNKLKICCLTWNMHGLGPTTEQVEELLNPHKGFDIYCIGSEECLRSIMKSFFYSDKKVWEEKLQNYFGTDYKLLSSNTLCAIHLIIFIKEKYFYELTEIKKNVVKTGGKNLFGNKGAVGISFKLFGMSFMIVNCHLAALHGRSEQRNTDFKRCVLNMSNNNDKNKSNNNSDDYNFFIFMGDLNYRLTDTSFNVNQVTNNYLNLLSYDELQKEIINKRLDTLGFQEGKIYFMPTFKYWNNTNDFQYFDTKNIDQYPAWCDRIFYRKNISSNKNIIDITQERYDSMQNIKMSDHKPLFSYFNILYI